MRLRHKRTYWLCPWGYLVIILNYKLTKFGYRINLYSQLYVIRTECGLTIYFIYSLLWALQAQSEESLGHL